MNKQPKPLYQIIASIVSIVDARTRCYETNNREWFDKWEAQLEYIEKNLLPLGSGIDNGTTIDRTRSTDNKLIFNVGFHHMDEHGYYSHWTHHIIKVKPSLVHNVTLSISGKDDNRIKEHLYDVFYHCLTNPVIESYYAEKDETSYHFA